LVVIDIQQRLMAAMPEACRHSVLTEVAVLTQAAMSLAIPTLVTEQYPKGLGATEACIAEHIAKSKPIEKTCFSCAGVDEFISVLRASKRRNVILTGVEAHICVLQTALDLHQQGYQVFVVEDAISSRNLQHKNNAIHRLRQAGVIITNVESVLFEWLGDAVHPEFKTISKLLI